MIDFSVLVVSTYFQYQQEIEQKLKIFWLSMNDCLLKINLSAYFMFSLKYKKFTQLTFPING